MIMSILKQSLQGKSILRSMMNEAVSGYQISGKVLDLGSGDAASYYDYLDIATDCSIEKLDKYSHEATLVVDLENPPQVEKAEYDQILCFNLLEHLYFPDKALTFAYQSLRSKGSLIGFVPFMIRVHPDPHDYHRYTAEALECLLDQAGFKQIQVTSVGISRLVVGWNMIYDLFPTWVRPVLLAPIVLVDKFLSHFESSTKEFFPLGYVFEAKK